MFLLASVVVGLAAGLLRAWITHRSPQSYDIRSSWLILFAFLPQLIFFVLPTKASVPDSLAPAALIASQIGLLLFAIVNLKIPGFWILTIGLALNLTVILFNGGLMPISPATAMTIFPDAPSGALVLGERLGTGKDILLAVEHTRLWFLSDRFLIPYGPGYFVAFSLGDVFVTSGIIWVLWGIGAAPKPSQTAASKLSLCGN